MTMFSFSLCRRFRVQSTGWCCLIWGQDMSTVYGWVPALLLVMGSVQSPSKLHHVRGRSVSSHTQGRSAALHHFSNRLRSKKITLKLINTPTCMHTHRVITFCERRQLPSSCKLGLLSPHHETECVWSQSLLFVGLYRLSQLAFPLTGFVENRK